MLPLDAALRSLAHLASLRGRLADADALTAAADAILRGDRAGLADAAPVVRQALADVRERGAEAVLTEARTLLPRDLRLLADRSGLSLDEIASIQRLTGATSLGEWRASVAGSEPAVPGRARDVLANALPALAPHRSRTPLGRAWALAEPLMDTLREACPGLERVELTGSLRRYAALVGDVDLLGSAGDPDAVAAVITGLPFASDVLHASRGRVVVRSGTTEITVRLVRPDVWGAALVVHTGSPAHVETLDTRARARGLSLGPEGLRRSGRLVPTPDERDVYEALDLPWIPPELRETGEEIAAAEEGRLPSLVTEDAVRGDLHMHSDWSDGHDTIEAMVSAAEALGYEYVAVTDHSQASAIARGLDAARLERQADEVHAVRTAHPGITVLHGSEVDILPDGSLDFPDRVIERLDVVLASLHDAAGQDGGTLTRRYVRAMQHPLVQIVTHPTNRLVPGRAGYDLDEALFFETAARTGTVVEIDGAPAHLDMDGDMARRAVAAGVDVSIDGDCHRAGWLGRQMRFGVATARRGWVECRHVVNTRPLEELRTRLAGKRRTTSP